ncbi:DMT family transporter [Porphyromonas pogonae]|uniref:DMT family transporter n=1 Tax=Porphyromonas pogonae TaxID=867595 RepID=UPI002E79BCAA|nr:DMT family transporter [Porphyromonas pogonae]
MDTRVSRYSFKGHAYILIATALWGINAPIGKQVLSYLDATTVVGFRLCGGLMCFWLLSLFLPREHVETRDKRALLLAGIFGALLNQGLFIFGLSKTSPINASIITTTSPIITMILAAIFLKEPVTQKKVLGVFIGLVGALVLIFTNHAAVISGQQGSIWGDIMVLIAQFSFAFYLTRFRGLIGKYSVVTLNKYMFLSSSVCILPFVFIKYQTINWVDIPQNIWLRLAFVVVGATFLTYILMMYAQKMLKPTMLSMYNYVQPIVSAIYTVAIGMDTFGPDKILAVALVFVGVYIVTTSKINPKVK